MARHRRSRLHGLGFTPEAHASMFHRSAKKAERSLTAAAELASWKQCGPAFIEFSRGSEAYGTMDAHYWGLQDGGAQPAVVEDASRSVADALALAKKSFAQSCMTHKRSRPMGASKLGRSRR